MGPSVWRTVAAGALAGRLARAARTRPATDLGRLFVAAFDLEWEHRRFFLWLPALAGTGVLLYFAADREPVLWLPAAFALGMAALAVRLRHNRPALLAAAAVAAIAAGFLAAGLRTHLVGAPVLSRLRIAHLGGLVEEVDHRRTGSRFVLRVTRADELAPAARPTRVRLTTRRDDQVEAGDRVTLAARLLPPAGAAMPGGYAFGRDAYFLGLGAVGSVLGRVRPDPASGDAALSWREAALTVVDRTRNALALRVDTMLGGGDIGAIAAAMVTGKRDLLSDDGRAIIREAGIFHIITIAGVQMTLVAGLLYGGTRRLLALSPALALRRPIKKWAALAGIAGAIGYDILTGSRIGTQRALIMTLVMLGAVLVDRRGFTMRNLALAALVVVLVEPESILGASFQLSFAAVAALIAVYEARQRRREAATPEAIAGGTGAPPGWLNWPWIALLHGRDLLVATACATAATASFMAADFHELSPYVLAGNPLTLGIIEFFAVPGALLGCVLYPLGLDGPVWGWVGVGIRIVLAAARLIAAAPASTVSLPAFAPWALPLLALAVLSAVIWRSAAFRLTAVPLALIGLLGTALGPRYDLIVAGGGDAVAARGADGRLALTGKLSPFAAEQWLRADGDPRSTALLHGRLAESGRCDALACIVPLPGGQTLSLVDEAEAFAEDCRRADVIVTALQAPASCAAPLIVDRTSLAGTGALGFSRRNGGWVPDPVRGPMEDRPWSPAPPRPAADTTTEEQPAAPPEVGTDESTP